MNRLSSLPKDETEKLRAQRDEAQQALQDFIYAVSHDLGAPLRAVTGFSDILQNKYAARLDEKGQNYLHFISEGGSKAQRMLAGLLQYSRIHTQAKPPGPTDINAVLDQAFEEMRGKITAQSAQITCGPLPVVMADSDQLRQLFVAIIDNALTFHDVGIAPRIHIDAEYDSFNAAAPWKILIGDNGIGIAPEDCPKVFQIFRRLHANDAYPGIGMGLTVAKRIVARHGGDIGIKPNRPGGAVCWFTLPKAAATAS